MSTLALADLAGFVALFALSALVRSRFKHHGYSATSAFDIVMAIGIFADAALTQLPLRAPLLARSITLELCVIWLFLARSYAASAINRHFRMHTAHPLRRFAIGTWVAGTAVLSVLVSHTLPEVHRLDQALLLIAVLVYLPYVAIFVDGYYRLLRHPLRQKANGVILLAVVSTQSIVIAIHTAYGIAFPPTVVLGLVVFDLIFLLAGLALIALHYRVGGSWLLAVEWKNTNCIVHGAVSITGLTLVLVSNFPSAILLAVWKAALVLFVVIEALEFVRLVEREHRRGWRRGLLVYDVTQWARNFTYGMFYAFSLALDQHLAAAGSLPADSLWYPVLRGTIEWGQYVVLAALLVEIALFFRARLHHFRSAATSRMS
jgi:hypothetical protein